MLGRLPPLRRAVAAPITYVTYDLRTEALSSLAIARPIGWHNVTALAKLARITGQEFRGIRTADLVLCFREDERRRLARWCHVPTRTLQPIMPAAKPLAFVHRPGNPYRFGFVADMTRVENIVSLRWLIDAVWLRLVRQFDQQVELHICGRYAPATAGGVLGTPGLVWHGWSEDLEQCYLHTDLMIAPLRIRGGIKFKVIESLAYGRPVVATRIAVDGYPASVVDAVEVADTADEWLHCLMAHVVAPPEGPSMAAARAAAANTAYDFRSMVRSIAQAYVGLVEGSAPT